MKKVLPILGIVVTAKFLCGDEEKEPLETVKPTVQNNSSDIDKKEAIRKYMSELGKKSGEARRKKKAI